MDRDALNDVDDSLNVELACECFRGGRRIHTRRQRQVELLNRQMLLHKAHKDRKCLSIVLVDQLGEHFGDGLDLFRGLVEWAKLLHHFFAGVRDQTQEDLHVGHRLAFLDNLRRTTSVDLHLLCCMLLLGGLD